MAAKKKKPDDIVLTPVTYLVDDTGARYRFADGVLANIVTSPGTKGPKISIGMHGAVFAARVTKEET